VLGLDPEHPLCGKCFTKWKHYGNPDYLENYCHACGKESGDFAEITIARPLCENCFRNYQP
jgi:predicted amidophosphoribosyltransferase